MTCLLTVWGQVICRVTCCEKLSSGLDQRTACNDEWRIFSFRESRIIEFGFEFELDFELEFEYIKIQQETEYFVMFDKRDQSVLSFSEWYFFSFVYSRATNDTLTAKNICVLF